MKVQILIRLKSGVLDVQGKAVEHGLLEMGFRQISNVRIGKVVELDLEEANPDKARVTIEELCNKLLANPIIENYEIKTTP